MYDDKSVISLISIEGGLMNQRMMNNGLHNYHMNNWTLHHPKGIGCAYAARAAQMR